VAIFLMTFCTFCNIYPPHLRTAALHYAAVFVVDVVKPFKAAVAHTVIAVKMFTNHNL